MILMPTGIGNVPVGVFAGAAVAFVTGLAQLYSP
jgi:hypothetical protein